MSTLKRHPILIIVVILAAMLLLTKHFVLAGLATIVIGALVIRALGPDKRHHAKRHTHT